MIRWKTSVLVLLLVLPGCVSLGSYMPNLGNSRPSVQGVNQVKVQRGDSVYAISRKYGVSMRDIIAANNLSAPYMLRVGQVLTLPRARVHMVRKGDTIYAISRTYGVDMAALTRLNGIRAPYVIHVNQPLVLPGSDVQEASVAASSRPHSASPSKPRTSPAVARPAPRQVPTPPARAGKFQWPVKGKVVANYGAQGPGQHNDGVNISAPRGTPFVAAENGVVVYAGNDLKGFGNLLLIKHSDGWMTAYAHADSLAVERGAKVAKGQVIGKVGSTGGVETPQLHFEIRQRKKAVDPGKYLTQA